jgi:threonylcarbamoyladenosine tRNA methylthiotransferase MtaB
MSSPRSDQVVTFGCRLNTYESGVIQSFLKEAGKQSRIVVNTCAVTQESERQARQAIRRLRKQNPEAAIIVTGCAAQLWPDHFASMPEVDLVLGNQEKMLPESYAKVSELDPKSPKKAPIFVEDINQVRALSGHLVAGFENRVRAFVEIQNGCNHDCTFCVITKARGMNRSVPLGALVEQTRMLLSQGIQEVVFTGVDITDYGGDLPGRPSFTQMIGRYLKALPELRRLRLSSLDPAELDETFFELIASEKRIMPHFHISLQAGSDLILKRMKRRHLSHHIRDFCERIREVSPHCILGADVIAGFPTETDAHFDETYALLEAFHIPLLHVFPYSARPGTPAARMPQVPTQIIRSRAAHLRTLGKRLYRQTLDFQRMQRVSGLLETSVQGHTDTFLPFRVQAPLKKGQRITGVVQDVLEGEGRRPSVLLVVPDLEAEVMNREWRAEV